MLSLSFNLKISKVNQKCYIFAEKTLLLLYNNNRRDKNGEKNIKKNGK